VTATEDIIQAVHPPEDQDWPESETSSVFADLIGSASGLIQAAPLINGFLGAHRRDRAFSFWKRDQLFEDFISAIPSDTHGGLAWGHNDNFKAWSGLFFLNKAEINLAAALDICLNAWLRWRLKMDTKDVMADNAWLSMWPSSKTIILKSFCERSEKPAELLDDLEKSSQHGSDAAQEFLLDLRTECEDMTVEEVYGFLREKKGVTLMQGAMVVFNRVNDFKHRVHGLMDRRGVDYATEWALAAIAHVGIGTLWKEGMLRDTGHLWKTKNPVASVTTG